MPKSEVDQWKEDIAAEDYICGPNPSLCGPGYDPNWETQTLQTWDISLQGPTLTVTHTQVDTIRGSHTEESSFSVTYSPPAYRTTSVDTVQNSGPTEISREVLSLPLGPLGSITTTQEQKVPVPEIDTDDDDD